MNKTLKQTIIILIAAVLGLWQYTQWGVEGFRAVFLYLMDYLVVGLVLELILRGIKQNKNNKSEDSGKEF